MPNATSAGRRRWQARHTPRRKIEERCDYRILGSYENGFRHISNRLRPIHSPADMEGMRIRVLPSEVQARTFELLGAEPLRWDFTEAIAAIKAGTIDAQENPFANTVTYRAHKFHHFHTVTRHFYMSRPIFVHRGTFDARPTTCARHARAVRIRCFQREVAIDEDAEARKAIVYQGCEMSELTTDEHELFKQAVEPLWIDARKQFGKEMFEMMPA